MGSLLRFQQCEVEWSDEQRYLETRFLDGTSVPARPHDTDSYRDTAWRLGYGSDTWTMCKEHEVSHTRLAEMFGLPYSPTLWGVAHGQDTIPDRPAEMGAEEDLVLAYQRWNRIRSGTFVEPANVNGA